MKRILLPLFILINIFCFARGKETGNNHSLIWRISGKDLPHASYLFGTMHVICSDKYLWTAPMAACLDSSRAICLEMNLNDPNVMTKVATAMINTNGATLDAFFTSQQYNQLKKYVKDSLGMDMDLLGHMNLVGLGTMLSLGGTSGCKEQVSYEEKLMSAANDAHKEITGLEEPEEQIALLNKIPADSLVRDIMDIVTGKASGTDDYDKLVAAYTTQDLPKLYYMMKDENTGISDLNAFLDERNKKWISRMAGKMKQQPVFFAVGAGHLWGPNGIISLLKKAGYTVTPVLQAN
ncbi:MAG: TraB/GumN family protein [Flavipsychrobacter sp.]|nr:TraB/GumN family protein [Flavipsychrobacter sp.]